MTENRHDDPLIQNVEALLEAERERREELLAQIAEIDTRIMDLKRLYPTAFKGSQAPSGSGGMPSRMKPTNLMLLKWLSAFPNGAPLGDILRYCEENDLMDERFLRIFIRNYKGRRYGLIGGDLSGNIYVTEKGRLFLAQVQQSEVAMT